MPSYDYKCDDCGYSGTRVHTMAFSEDVVCMNCGTPMRKLFTAVPTHFKGSGWGGKPQLWTTNSTTKKVEKYKGDVDPGKSGATKPKYT